MDLPLDSTMFERNRVVTGTTTMKVLILCDIDKKGEDYDTIKLMVFRNLKDKEVSNWING